MKILDCSSFESTKDSLEDLLGLRLDARNIFLDMMTTNCDSEVLKAAVDQRLAENPIRVHWFHITRVTNAFSVKEGILPTYLAIEDIWREISITSDGILSSEELVSLRLRTESHSQAYISKVANSRTFGPHALLIRELLTISDPGFVSTHNLPELIFDILGGFESELGKKYVAGTRLCLIKFYTIEKERQNVVALVTRALLYWFDKEFGCQLEATGNPNYCGDGVPIPSKQILEVVRI